MSKFRLDRPYVLGLLVYGALVTYWVIAAVVRGANPLAILIIIAVGIVGSGMGLYVAWLIRTKITKK